jgi:virulence factor Mce-like protein
MKRIVLGGLAVAVAVVAIAGVDVRGLAARLPGVQFFGITSEPAGAYRVDAIFDTAKGVIPGQLVKVAGVKVGTVADVTLTGDFKARIQMVIDSRFAPFRSDARCDIRPEGLTAENFVQCDPGSPRGHALAAHGGTAATVPVAHTTVPINLNGLFQVWNAPTADRLRILVNELGIGLAARGGDLNAILRRTNPALGEARRAIGILTAERAQLATIVDATDKVTGELAGRSGQVRDFVHGAARLTTTTARQQRALAATIHRLPGVLRASRPTLQRADRFATTAAPLAASLRRSAGPFTRVLANLRTFSAAAAEPLRGLERTVTRSRPILAGSKPTLDRARRFTDVARPVAPRLRRLFVSLRDRGLIEGVLKLFYYVAAASARFDATSHILPAHLILNGCVLYAASPVPGCSAHYGDESAGRLGTRGSGRSGRSSGTGGSHPAPAGGGRVDHNNRGKVAHQPTAPAGSPPSSPPAASPTPPAPEPQAPPPPDGAPLTKALDDLLGYLLR